MSDRIFCEIKNLKDFLEECLGKSILEYALKPLTKPGDNYGSELQAIEVKLTDNEIVHMVAKTCVTDPEFVKIFQPTHTFVKENRFYSDIIPTLENFQVISNVPESERIDSFIRCFGSRISLNSDANTADADALLLLENTKILNYINGDRHIGFDTNETLAIMKSLAHYHALFIAVRRSQPEVFRTKISPYLNAICLILDTDGTIMADSTANELHLVDGLDEKLRTKIQKQLKIGLDFARDVTRASDTPYTTLVHRDLWINNIMIKKDNNADEPIKIKIYDFQLYFYQSFVHDLIFFLCTSVRRNDLVNDFLLFIHCYHAEFVKTLKLVNCSLDDYTFEKMWEEIQKRAKIEMLHILFMIKVTTADLDSLGETSPDAFYNWKQLPNEVLKRWKIIIKIFTENEFI